MKAPQTGLLFLSFVCVLGCTTKPRVRSALDTQAPSGQVDRDFGTLAMPADVSDGSEWEFGKTRLSTDPADAAKKPFGLEPFYQQRWVSAPRWSPDGSRVLFAVNNQDIRAGTSVTNLYLADATGRSVRQMTNTDGYNGAHRWSPDGSQFVFVSNRDEGNRLWLMPADGGEPRALPEVPTGVSSPMWLPGGKHVVFASEVFPEWGADMEANEKLLDDLDLSPMKAHVAEHLLFRHWNRYWDGRRNHLLLMNIDNGEIKDLTPGNFHAPPFNRAGSQFDVSPDGRELVFTSNREPLDAQAWTTNSDIWVVSLEGGEPLNITADNKAGDLSPRYSPDGRYIAYLRQERPGAESDMFNLVVYDRQSGDLQFFTEELDFHVIDFNWAQDGQKILFKVAQEGRYPLYTADLRSGEVAKVAHLPSVKSFQISRDGTQVAFTFDKIGQPVELFVSEITGSKSIRLTSVNDALVAEYDIRPAEELWLEGADGKKVHTFVVKPHGFDPSKKYPLILNVHGGPQMQWSDGMRGDWQVYPAHGYIVAFPNPHGSTGYGQEYTDAISRDWNGKVIEDVMKVTDQLAALDYVDEERMGAMGWSWGGYAMNWIMGRPHPFKAFVSMMGMFDMRAMYYSTEEMWFPEWDLGKPWEDKQAYETQSPSSYVENFHTPTLVITGEKDYRIPYTQSIMLFTALKRRGVPAKIIIFPEDGHWPNKVKSMPLYYTAHLEWFHKYLGGEAPTYPLQQLIRGRAFD